MKILKFFIILAILIGVILGATWLLEIFPKDQVIQYSLKIYGVLGLIFLASMGISVVIGKAKPTSTKNGPQFK